MDFFILENEVPVLSPEARLMPLFNDVIKRDRGGSTGDYDGRKKFIAMKELAFVYFKYHPTSRYKDSYSESKLDDVVKKNLGLPEEWVEDNTVKKAGVFYASLMGSSITLKTLNTARSTLFTANDVIAKYQKLLEEQIADPDKNNLANMSAAMDTLKSLMTICKGIPDTVKIIEELAEKVAKEVESSKLGNNKRIVDRMQLPDK